MSLKAQIEADVKSAMRAGEALRRDTLRMLLADMQKREVALNRDLTPEEQLDTVGKAVKTRLESVEQFQKAGRAELVAKEQAEIQIVKGYLPKQLDEAATRALLTGLISELKLSSKKDLGTLMKAVMAGHKGAVDGKLVQQLVAELLP